MASVQPARGLPARCWFVPGFNADAPEPSDSIRVACIQPVCHVRPCIFFSGSSFVARSDIGIDVS